MDTLSWIHHISPQELEELYQKYLQDIHSVDEQWQRFFQGFEFARANYSDEIVASSGTTVIGKEFNVMDLIQSYRQRGHYFTATNPVRKRRSYSPTLAPENFGLDESDLDKEFAAGNDVGLGKAKLKDIIHLLNETYCGSVGVEFMYIRLPGIVEWLKNKMEASRNMPAFSDVEKRKIFSFLSQSVLFENFLQKRFPGQKRFSLEGAENFIPAVQILIEHGATLGVKDFVFGMAHRGRLNMLANVLEKPATLIFAEFAGKEFDESHLLGDVKYHLGYVSKRNYEDGKTVTLTLCPNPSHLEAVGPVVQGLARSKAEKEKLEVAQIVPVVVHGDASVAGQGIVYEQLQMSELPAHSVGGTIHIVINNQVGFTTDYIEGRSSIYCTDVAKVIQSPIFHVNGDDAEAVAYTMKLALEYRMKFKKDVFVDLLCYRRHGHNESDEPRYTQPQLYNVIEQHPNPMKIYAQKLFDDQVIDNEFVDKLQADYFSNLDVQLENASESKKVHLDMFLEDQWSSFFRANENDVYAKTETAVDIDVLMEIGRKINTLPPEMKAYSKLKRLLNSRLEMIENEHIDWALAEQLAYASLLNEGSDVRLCGQDSERGTFSHRHAVWNFEDSTEKYYPLNHIRKGQANFNVYNSLLSEYAVLGFEYGYALYRPNDLTIWEAQFGDFGNGAQIIIDQFISSAEEKWGVMNNLVLYLPHGYEGQGPEHSSARMERFLNLCANYNMDVVQCSSPASFFHVLRRHLKRNWRKPLVLFTPKSLLRHPKCVSGLDELTSGDFELIIDDSSAERDKVTKFLLCSGRIYYDLMEEIEKRNDNTIALIRLEQIYPFPIEKLMTLIKLYPNVNEFVWVQDEPANMGAWSFLSKWLRPLSFKLVSRPFSSSPAAGSYEMHKLRHKKIMDKVFGDCVCERNSNECKMICLGSTPNEIQL